MKYNLFSLYLIFLSTLCMSFSSKATVIYFNDFQSTSDMTGWSHTIRTTDNNGETVLGIFPTKTASVAGRSWSNTGEVTFTRSLAPGNYTVSFDFFTLMSWDGHGGCCQPDYFIFRINGTPFVNATFSNNPGSNQYQGYSPTTPLAGNTVNNTPTTGNTGKNILDITPFSGSPANSRVPNYRYSMTFDFIHPGGDLVLSFLGKTIPTANDACTNYWCGMNYYDEPWAIDNLKIVTAGLASNVPEPTTLALLGLGLAGLRFSRRSMQPVH